MSLWLRGEFFSRYVVAGSGSGLFTLQGSMSWGRVSGKFIITDFLKSKDCFTVYLLGSFNFYPGVVFLILLDLEGYVI